MAVPKKRGTSWFVQVRKKGVSKSASFSTKAEATAWATKIEAEILSGKKAIQNKPLSAMMEKYAEEVSQKKPGAKWEKNRLAYFGRSDLGKIMIPDLTPADIGKWRDDRLKLVKGSTVNRDWNLLSNMFSVARDEWGWIHENPMSKVKRPPEEEPRDYLIVQQDIDDILHSSGYDKEVRPETISELVGAAFMFAIETAMRQGEIAAIRWPNVDLKTKVLHVPKSKNGTRRNVPLSTEAIRILNQLEKNKHVFDLTASQIESNFREIKTMAGRKEDFTFHDTRHLAITRLSKKLDIRPLARMTGHKDINKLMIYYNEPAEEIAKLLG